MGRICRAAALVLLTPALMAGGCDDEWEMPPLKEPRYDGPVPNVTVAEFRARYGSQPSGTLIAEDWVLDAVVTANDESGNFFKQLVVADETGAIPVVIDQTGLHAANRVGQRIVIALRALAATKYGGELQIGYRNAYAARIPWPVWNEAARFDGWPDPAAACPTLATMAELADTLAGDRWAGALVELRDVRFVLGGEADFTEDNAPTGRVIADRQGRAMEVRTSPYADFATERLPAGWGTLVGIAGRYNGIWQLTLRSRSDVRFDGVTP